MLVVSLFSDTFITNICKINSPFFVFSNCALIKMDACMFVLFLLSGYYNDVLLKMNDNDVNINMLRSK